MQHVCPQDTSQRSEQSPSASEEEEDEEGGEGEGGGSGGEGVESGEDMDVPVKVEVEDIPLTKPGYSTPPIYPPIQVGVASLYCLCHISVASFLLTSVPKDLGLNFSASVVLVTEKNSLRRSKS